MTSGAYDVIVIGAGPAGAAAAIRLAMVGRRVVVVDRPSARDRSLLQHAPPSMLAPLHPLGVADRVFAEALTPVDAHEVRWGSPQHSDHERPGWLLDRAKLGAVLAGRLADIRIEIVRGVARPPTNVESASGRSDWVVNVDGSRLVAPVLVHATGRIPPWAQPRRTSPPTVAIVGRWSAPVASAVSVTALADSWAWTGSVAGRTAMAIEFMDSRPNRAGGSPPFRERASDLLERLPTFRGSHRSLMDAWMCPATTAIADRPIDGTRLCLGDSASSIDPLTSQGVQAALRSGLHGAAVINTLLTPDGDHDLARQFFRDRTHVAHGRHGRHCADFYAEQAACTPSEFWLRRSAGAGPQGVSPRPPTPEVIRFVTTDRLWWTPEATWTTTGVLEDDHIVPRPALDHPGLDAPIAFIGGSTVAILRDVVDGDALGVTIDRLRGRGLGDAATAVVTDLLRRGVLRQSGSDRSHAPEPDDRAAQPTSTPARTARAAIRSG